jgi:hypothetical protein
MNKILVVIMLVLVFASSGCSYYGWYDPIPATAMASSTPVEIKTTAVPAEIPKIALEEIVVQKGESLTDAVQRHWNCVMVSCPTFGLMWNRTGKSAVIFADKNSFLWNQTEFGSVQPGETLLIASERDMSLHHAVITEVFNEQIVYVRSETKYVDSTTYRRVFVTGGGYNIEYLLLEQGQNNSGWHEVK